uniref:Putative secreted protein n=1 Tax=Ixodes ricinus TaxID=34613 RepID=A0A6B0UN92_IXORI
MWYRYKWVAVYILLVCLLFYMAMLDKLGARFYGVTAQELSIIRCCIELRTAMNLCTSVYKQACYPLLSWTPWHFRFSLFFFCILLDALLKAIAGFTYTLQLLVLEETIVLLHHCALLKNK